MVRSGSNVLTAEALEVVTYRSGVRAGETEDTERLLEEYAATRDPALRDQVLEAYLPLSYHLAQRFRNRGEPVEDLAQVAALAMVKAIDRFEPDRGVRFSTFAVPTIVGELKRHFRDRVWAVRVPRRLKDLRVTVAAELAGLGQLLGRSPTIPEIAERLGVPDEDVLEALEAGAAFRTESLTPVAHDPVDETADDAGWVAAALAVQDHRAELVDDHDELRRLLDVLAERERTIVYLRFFQGLTQSQIAAQVGVSQMHVSRLLQRSLLRLREAGRDGGLEEGALAPDRPPGAAFDAVPSTTPRAEEAV
jgi:RNA polymerase sigma-B factor